VELTAVPFAGGSAIVPRSRAVMWKLNFSEPLMIRILQAAESRVALRRSAEGAVVNEKRPTKQ
jgi:hypothetical protein